MMLKISWAGRSKEGRRIDVSKQLDLNPIEVSILLLDVFIICIMAVSSDPNQDMSLYTWDCTNIESETVPIPRGL